MSFLISSSPKQNPLYLHRVAYVCFYVGWFLSNFCFSGVPLSCATDHTFFGGCHCHALTAALVLVGCQWLPCHAPTAALIWLGANATRQRPRLFSWGANTMRQHPRSPLAQCQWQRPFSTKEAWQHDLGQIKKQLLNQNINKYCCPTETNATITPLKLLLYQHLRITLPLVTLFPQVLSSRGGIHLTLELWITWAVDHLNAWSPW